MNPKDVQQLYNEGYAKEYNKTFLESDLPKSNVAVELRVIRALLDANSRWLDLGCGTGYFLSQFPDIKRAGLDLSPGMLQLARQANPDALFIEQGDFTQPHEEWKSQWSLVSCMWGAYGYVNSMQQLEQLLTNMIEWTAPGGSIFIPIVDLEDVRLTQLPYEQDIPVFGGVILLTGVLWTYIEENKANVHENMVAPHVEHFVHLLSPWFDEIEIVRYPPYMPGWTSRKAVLAKKRRKTADKEKLATVIRQPIPPPTVLPDGSQRQPSPLQFLSHRQLLGELLFRLKSGSLLRSAIRKLLNKQ